MAWVCVGTMDWEKLELSLFMEAEMGLVETGSRVSDICSSVRVVFMVVLYSLPILGSLLGGGGDYEPKKRVMKKNS